MTAAIEISGLTKRFGDLVAVDDLSLEVPAGSIFGFLGANGAGKTTTIRTIAGLSRPTSGGVRVGGITSAAGPTYLRAIGYLCQEPAFYGWMTGREVLRYASGFHPELDEPIERRIDELLELVGLRDAGNRRSGKYSGGMRQRLGIATALIGRPSVVVLDEPAAGLDPIGRREILELMESLRGTTTVFYSTHILDDVQRVSDRVAVLDRGRLITTAATDELLSSFTRDRLRVELVGATAETASRLAAIPGVGAVSVDETPAGSPVFTVRLSAGESGAPSVQASITRFASAEGFAVAEARPIVLGLEEVFLHLVGQQEVAA